MPDPDAPNAPGAPGAPAAPASPEPAASPALSGFRTLLTRQSGGVLHLTLNQPASRNAMSLLMVRELSAALAAAEASAQTGGPTAVRVIVLRGAGGHFCSGGDLKDMAAARSQPVAGGPDPLIAVSAAFGQVCAAFASTPLATVALLEGSVMGGGFGLACAVDIAVATETAVFRLPEVHRGIVPAQIAPFLLERLGYSQAKRLAISGASLDAHQAFALGLVHELVGRAPADAQIETTHAPSTGDAAAAAIDSAVEAAIEATLQPILRSLLLSAPGAVAATKTLLAECRFSAAGEHVARAAERFAAAARGPEGSEGMTSFIQKRKPAWAPAESE